MILLAILGTASISSLIFPVGREGAAIQLANATVLKSSSKAAMRPVSA
jgi:hypothetical protein